MPFGKAFLCLSIAILFVQCQRDDSSEVDIQDQTNDGLTISKLEYDSQNILRDFSFTYSTPNKNQFVKMKSSVDENNQLNSVLLVSVNGKKWTRINEVSLDLSKEDYKKTTNFMIEDLANSLKENQNAETIDEYEKVLNELPELLFDKLGGEDYASDAVLSVFYHLSTFRSAKRAYAMNLDECNCGTFQSYVHNEAPFFCSEDQLVSSDEVLDLIREKIIKLKYSNDKHFIPKKTIDYIQQSGKKYFPASDLDILLRKEFNTFWTKTLTEKERKYTMEANGIESLYNKRAIGGPLPTWPIPCFTIGVVYGSDCGCCGNYSGHCWLCTLACLKHDRDCEYCIPSWYCLSGCVPGPCTN